MSEMRYRSSGLGFWSVLFLVFLVLKLTDVIDWSWWWIAAPLWIPFVIVLAVGLVAAATLSWWDRS